MNISMLMLVTEYIFYLHTTSDPLPPQHIRLHIPPRDLLHLNHPKSLFLINRPSSR